MNIGYLVHDLHDAAVARRLRMYAAAGAEARVLGFSRGRAAPASVAGVLACDLGETRDAALLERAMLVARRWAAPGKIRAIVAGSDAIVARNLETLVIAARIRAAGQRLIYECLDIHRMMLREDAIGRVMRGIEARVLEQVDLLICSSPAYIRDYFGARQHYRGRSLLVENKLLILDRSRPTRPAPLPGPPWRIGWFGMIRCRQSLDLLRALVREGQGRVEVLIAGRPSYTEFDDFDAAVADTPGLRFAGPYAPQDLAGLYGQVHYTWAIDYFEAGQNSAWLLPNRLYEGIAHGSIPIALRGLETAAWLERHEAGVLFDAAGASIGAFFAALDAETHARQSLAIGMISQEAVIADEGDCERLVAAIAGST